jgi:hypothetical protein
MAFIANFGLKNGVHTWRVNGSKEELIQLVLALNDEGAQYKDGVGPKIEHVHNSGYTLLLELLIEEKGAAGNDHRENTNPNGQNIGQFFY